MNKESIKHNILFIHNKYLQKGGEDSVVEHEIAILKRNGYTVHLKTYTNELLNKKPLNILLAPVFLFFNPFSFIEIFFLVKRKKISVVHVHNFFYTASPSIFWAAKLAGANTIFTLHNYRLFCLNGIFFRNGHICMECHTNKHFNKGIAEKCFKSSKLSSYALAKATFFHRATGTWTKKLDKFVVINPYQAILLNDIGISKEKIIYKPNIIGQNLHTTKTDYIKRGDFYLYVGRLSKEKGIEHLIEAFKESGKKLVVVGNGELANFVQKNKTANIDYRGALLQEEIFRLYAQCKALIFPSLWLEGMPMTIIEAQSTGTITIAAGSENTARMIENGKTGYLYEAGNISSLLAVINIFEAQNTDEHNRLSDNVYRQYLDQYSEQKYLDTAKQLYQF